MQNQSRRIPDLSSYDEVLWKSGYVVIHSIILESPREKEMIVDFSIGRKRDWHHWTYLVGVAYDRDSRSKNV